MPHLQGYALVIVRALITGLSAFLDIALRVLGDCTVLHLHCMIWQLYCTAALYCGGNQGPIVALRLDRISRVQAELYSKYRVVFNGL